jgi:non-specific serine/threonine protein kinase
MAANSATSFGDLLRRYRLAAGLTQEDLAERATLSARAISDLERGARNRPWRETVQLLANALRLSTAERAQLDEAAQRPSRPDGGPVPPVPPAAALHQHNLPLHATTFVGRAGELREIRQLLGKSAGASRLVTLTGTGGCGKTRLALQAAEGLMDQFPDGVWFVDLAALNDPALVPQAVARVLDIAEIPGRPMIASLVESLRSRQLLLLLDNCEHLIDACAQLTDALLQGCAQVWILATSREMLGVSGETTRRVPSLGLPEVEAGLELEQLRQNEALRLFVERAGAVASDFALTAQNAAAVVQICRRLDGIPLAIELAAARVRHLTVEEIATRLNDRFRLLTGGSRTALRRQQTLRALIDWSYELLSEKERVLFRRLSVFAGGWRVEAAEFVCAGGMVVKAEVLDLLAGLVDKSMVVVESEQPVTRYRFLETIRAYAGDKLFEAGEAGPLRDRHRDWCLALAREAEPELFGPASRVWIEGLHRDEANLHEALQWCLETDPDSGLRLGGSLWPYWYLDWGFADGIRWLGALLARTSGASPERGKALLGAAHCSRHGGTLSQSHAWNDECLAIARAVGDRRLAGQALLHLGNVLTIERDYGGAQAVLKESLALCREMGDQLWEGMGLRDLGHLARIAGDYERAATLYQGSLARLQAIGHRWNLILTLLPQGYLARQRNHPAEARLAFQRGLTISEEDGNPWRFIMLRSLGEFERSLGKPVEAEQLLREVLLEARRHGWTAMYPIALYTYSTLLLERGSGEPGARLAAVIPSESLDPVNSLPSDVQDHEAALQAARAAMGDAAFASVWAEGKAMTLEQAVVYALDIPDPSIRAPDKPSTQPG